ncbi:MAG: LCP family protein [Propionibacterium sp.]|nr:LCP family protein [Propionibacterium sp.]
MSNAATHAGRLHARRAVGFLVLSALVPGSVQRFAGNRTLGTVALRIWAGLLLLVIGVAVAALFIPGPVVAVLLTPWVAATARVLVWVVFAGWLVMLLDAWRLARPMRLRRGMRLGMTITVGVLAIAVGFGTSYVASAFTAAGNVGEVLPGGGDTEVKAGRYNILLLGLDAADDRMGIRPDSINVASVDAETGRTVLFGLPRNMQRVPFPAGSPMHGVYPDGFICPDGECMLNAVWTAGEANADLFPEGADPGLDATKDAISETLGLEINYYAMVDMAGFESIIDAMGGIHLDVMKRIPIGGGGSQVSGYIEPGKAVHLDGRHALWFARSRHGSSDYERMQRQKCVISAMVNQLDPQLVATRFVELSRAGKDLLVTDVGRADIVELVDLGLKARNREISSVNFNPPLVPNTAFPDFDHIRATVEEYIEAAELADEVVAQPSAPASPMPSPTPGFTTPAAPTTGPTPEESLSADPEAYVDETETEDLGVVCSAA